MIFSILGLIGAACMTGMYWALQSKHVTQGQEIFYIVNGIGAALLAISIAAHYDSGDLGGIAVEIVWFVISLLGFYNLKKEKTDER